MAIALVVVHKTFGGHKWSNTHCVRIGAADNSTPTGADLTASGITGTWTTTNTSGTPPDILHAIIGMERLLHTPDVQITDVLVTDGKRNTGPNASTIYATASMSLAGTLAGAALGLDLLEPGGITALYHRNVAGFGHKPGRLFIRGGLAESWVSVGGPRMVQWTGNAPNAALTTALASANTMMAPYYSPTAGSTSGAYMLPVYVTPKQKAANAALPPVGTLVDAIPITSLSLVGPVLRQVQRGRKRKTTP